MNLQPARCTGAAGTASPHVGVRDWSRRGAGCALMHIICTHRAVTVWLTGRKSRTLMSGPAEELRGPDGKGREAALGNGKYGQPNGVVCLVLARVMARVQIADCKTKGGLGCAAAHWCLHSHPPTRPATHLTFSRRITASMPLMSGSTTRASWHKGSGDGQLRDTSGSRSEACVA